MLWHKGRYELLADKGEEDGAVEVIDLYQVRFLADPCRTLMHTKTRHGLP